MEADAFCRSLFDFLVDFDGSIPPLGLETIREPV
jgi:hypothetical protein